MTDPMGFCSSENKGKCNLKVVQLSPLNYRSSFAPVCKERVKILGHSGSSCQQGQHCKAKLIMIGSMSLDDVINLLDVHQGN